MTEANPNGLWLWKKSSDGRVSLLGKDSSVALIVTHAPECLHPLDQERHRQDLRAIAAVPLLLSSLQHLSLFVDTLDQNEIRRVCQHALNTALSASVAITNDDSDATSRSDHSALAALTAENAKLRGVVEEWPIVMRFAQAMAERLEANKDKGGWDLCDLSLLFTELDQAKIELYNAVYRNNDPVAQVRRAANVGNFAMMIADRIAALSKGESHE